MRTIRRLPLALLLLLSPCAFAQSSTGTCPALPPGSGLTWQQVDGPDFLFCKAIRDTDGVQLFAVTLRPELTFRPNRANRAEEAVIDGHEVRWYRGEVPFEPNAIVRETTLEIDDDRIAHITLRANSEEQREQAQRLVEDIRFQDARLGSK